jgi:hypothetical protein
MARRDTPAPEAQCARAVLMVRPARFGFNRQTAGSNAFQHPAQRPEAGHSAAGAPEPDVQTLAVREFDTLASRLRDAGVEVIPAEDTPDPAKPDAVFPNNWVSFHGDGTVVLYPMLAANRRLERRKELIAEAVQRGAFRVVRTVDLSHREAQRRYLEGTGSMVLDRSARIAYASLSPRTDCDVLREFARQLDYELVTFEATGPDGKAVYHTNVLMAVGANFAVLCTAAITDAQCGRAVVSKLEATGHRVLEISPGQMRAFAGNLLELAGDRGPVIALSTTAWAAFHPAERRILEQHGAVLSAAIPTIEHIGGGGVRCMLAEIHLPKRQDASMS